MKIITSKIFASTLVAGLLMMVGLAPAWGQAFTISTTDRSAVPEVPDSVSTPTSNERLMQFAVVGTGTVSGTVTATCTITATSVTTDDDAEVGDFATDGSRTGSDSTDGIAVTGNFPTATVNFPASAITTARNCEFYIYNDDDFEQDESFTVTLTVTGGGATVGTASSVTGTIEINDFRIGFQDTVIRIPEGEQQQVCVRVTSPQDSTPMNGLNITLAFSTRAPQTTGVNLAAAADFGAQTNSVIGPFTQTHRRTCVSMETTEDTMNEADELLYLDLAPPPGVSFPFGQLQITPSQATVYIQDDDPITVSVSLPAQGVEGSQITATYAIVAGGGTQTTPIVMAYTIAGSGITAADFGFSSLTGTHSIATASPDLTLAIGIEDEGDPDDAPETFTFTSSGTSAGAVNIRAGDAEHTVQILPAGSPLDGPVFAITAGPDITEGASNAASGNFTITLQNQALAAATDVTWTVSRDTSLSNFVDGQDFTCNNQGCGLNFPTGTVNFGSGDLTVGSTKTFTVPIRADNLAEAREFFQVTLSGASGSDNISYGEPFTSSIAANDAVEVTITRVGTATEVGENATATFRFTLTGGTRGFTIDIPFTLSGLDNSEFAITTPSGIVATDIGGEVEFSSSQSQSTRDVVVNLQGDTLNEATETLTITGGAPQSFGNRPVQYTTNGDTASIDVTDDDAITVSIAITGPADAATATGHQVEEGAQATFTVTLSAASGGDVTVPYDISDADAADYSDVTKDVHGPTSANGSLIIPAGQTTGIIYVNILADADTDMSEGMTVALTADVSSTDADEGPTAGAGGGDVTVTSTSADAAQTVLIIPAAATTTLTLTRTASTAITETDAAQNIGFTISNGSTTDYTSAQSVTWTIVHGTTSDADFTAVTGTEMYTAADVTFDVELVGDTVNEATETFTINISTAAAATVIGPAVAVSVADNDDITYALPSAAVTVAEGAAASVTVTLSGESAGDITVPYALNQADSDTATGGGVDYNTPVPLSITIPAGSTTADIIIQTINDTLNEGDEQISVNTLIVAPGAGAGAVTLMTGGDSVDINITDNDTATLTVTRAAPTSGDIDEDGAAAQVFEFALAGALGGVGEATVDWEVRATTASTDTDAAAADFDFDNDGTADSALPSGTLTFAPGVRSRRLTVRLHNDTTQEGAEAFNFHTTDHAGIASLTRTAADSGIDITIAPSDHVREFTLDCGDASEGGAAATCSLTYTATDSGGFEITTTASQLTWTLSHAGGTPATAAADFASGATFSGSVPVFTAAAGTGAGNSVSITLPAAADDNLSEAAETFTVTISGELPPGTTVANGGEDTATIAASDPLTMTVTGGTTVGDISATSTAASEGATPMDFSTTITFTPANITPAGDISLRVNTGYTGAGAEGVDGNDYTLVDGEAGTDFEFIIAPGDLDSSNIYTFRGQVRPDSTSEVTERLSMLFRVPTSTAANVTAAGLVFRHWDIADDDDSLVWSASLNGHSHTPPEPAEEDSTGAATFIYLLAHNGTARRAMTVTYTFGGTAIGCAASDTTTADCDYNFPAGYDIAAGSGTASIAVGDNDERFVINLRNDNLNELAETITAQVTGVQITAMSERGDQDISFNNASVTRTIAPSDRVHITVTRADTETGMGDSDDTVAEAFGAGITFTWTLAGTAGAVVREDTMIAWRVHGSAVTLPMAIEAAEDADFTTPTSTAQGSLKNRGTFTIPAGTTIGGTGEIITIGIVRDRDAEAAERLVLRFPQGYGIELAVTAGQEAAFIDQAVVIDASAAVTKEFNLACPATIIEGTAANCTVTYLDNSATPAALGRTADGMSIAVTSVSGARNPADTADFGTAFPSLAATTTTINFASNDASGTAKTWSITALDDNVSETAETLLVTLSGDADVITSTATVDIAASDPLTPVLSITSGGTATVDEETSGAALMFTIALTDNQPGVTITTEGTSIIPLDTTMGITGTVAVGGPPENPPAGSDYQVAGDDVDFEAIGGPGGLAVARPTFAAESLSRDFVWPIIGDDLAEPDEMIHLTFRDETLGLTQISNAYILVPQATDSGGSLEFTISASDPITLTGFSGPGAGRAEGDPPVSIAEGQSAEFTFTLSGGLPTGMLQIVLGALASGSADASDIPTLSASFSAAQIEAARPGAPGGVVPLTYSAQITDDTVSEVLERITFAVTSIGPGDPADPHNIIPLGSGTAGTTQADIHGDADDSAVNVYVDAGGEIIIPESDITASVVSGQTPGEMAREGSSVNFTISLSDVSVDAVVMTYTAAINTQTNTDPNSMPGVDDRRPNLEDNPDLEARCPTLTDSRRVCSATAGAVGGSIDGSVTILADETSTTIEITVLQDARQEGEETFTVTLTGITEQSPAGGVALHPTTRSATAIIVENDGATRYLNASVDMTEVSEEDTPTVTFTVALTGAAHDSGSAAQTVDYVIEGVNDDVSGALTGTLDFGTGFRGTTRTDTGNTLRRTVQVRIINDNLNEAAEMMTFTISNPQGGSNPPPDGQPPTVAEINTATVTIAASDPITATFSGGGNVSEGGMATVNVSLSATPTREITIPYTIAADTDDATTNAVAADYTDANNGMLTLTADTDGNFPTSGTIELGIMDDTLNESAETFVVTVTVADISGQHEAAANVPNYSAQTFTINASDPVSVRVTAADDTVRETQTVRFTFTLEGAAGGSAVAFTVPYTVSGTSDTPFDAATSAAVPDGGGSVSIAAGENSATLDLMIPYNTTLGDGRNETLRVTIGNITAAAATANAAAGNFNGNGNSDTVRVNYVSAAHVVSLSGPTTEVAEGAMATFTVNVFSPSTVARTGDLMLTYELGGVDVGDYDGAATGTALIEQAATSADIIITITDDTVNEAAETMTLRLTGASGDDAATVDSDPAGTGAGVNVDAGTVSVTIPANDPITYAIGADASATEADTNEDAAVTHAFTVTLSGAAGGSMWERITIPVRVDTSSETGGTAESGDYSVSPSTLTFENLSGADFAAGNLTAAVTVSVRPDTVNELDETVIINLGEATTSGSGGGAIAASTADGATTATLTITDNDAATVSVAGGDTAVREGDDLVFTFTLSARSEQAVVVPWTAAIAHMQATGEDANDANTPEFREGNGIASDDLDFQTARGSLTFNPGNTRHTVRLRTNRDGLGEDAEVVTVTIGTLAAPTDAPALNGITAATPPTGTATIAANEGVPYRLSISPPAAADEDGPDNCNDPRGDCNVVFTINLDVKGLPTTRSGDDSGPVREEVMVQFEIGGSASLVAGTAASTSAVSNGLSVNDYGPPILSGPIQSGNTVTFRTTETMHTVTVPIVDDALNEPAETVTLTITRISIGGQGEQRNNPGPRGTRISGDGTATATVMASDELTPTLTMPTGTIVPGEDATYTVNYGTTNVRRGANNAPIELVTSMAATLMFSAGTGADEETAMHPVTLAAGTETTVTVPADVLMTGLANAFSNGDDVTVQLMVDTSATDSPPVSTAMPTVTQTVRSSRVALVNNPVAKDGTDLVFRVELTGNAAPSGGVTVMVAVAGGGDHPGLSGVETAAEVDDYTAPPSTVVIAAGERTADITVRTAVKDGDDAARESITVTISLPPLAPGARATVHLDTTNGDNTAIGVISDDDPAARSARVKTKLAVLGRATAVLASRLIESRAGTLNDPNARATFTLAGRAVTAPEDEDFAAASGTWAANPYERGRMMSETYSVSGGESMSTSQIVRQTSFNLSHGPAGSTLWGSAGSVNIDSDELALKYDGDVQAYHIGMEGRAGLDTVFGMSLGHSAADLDFDDTVATVTGSMKANTVSVHPYIIRRFSDNAHLWFTVGYGKSDVDITETAQSRGADRTETVGSRMQSLMAGAGLSGRRAFGPDLDISGRFLFTGSNSKLDAATFPSGNELYKVTATTLRLNNEWEVGYTQPLTNRNGNVRVFALGGVRKDFADAEQDAAVDIGGGVEVNTDGGFSLRIKGAAQVNNTVQDENSLSINLGLDRSKGFGLAPFTSLSLDDEGENKLSTGLQYRAGRLVMTLETVLSDEAGMDYGNLLRGEWRF